MLIFNKYKLNQSLNPSIYQKVVFFIGVFKVKQGDGGGWWDTQWKLLQYCSDNCSDILMLYWKGFPFSSFQV